MSSLVYVDISLSELAYQDKVNLSVGCSNIIVLDSTLSFVYLAIGPLQDYNLHESKGI